MHIPPTPGLSIPCKKKYTRQLHHRQQHTHTHTNKKQRLPLCDEINQPFRCGVATPTIPLTPITQCYKCLLCIYQWSCGVSAMSSRGSLCTAMCIQRCVSLPVCGCGCARTVVFKRHQRPECKIKRKRKEMYETGTKGKKGGRDYKTETERGGQREEGRIPEGGRETD